MTQKVTVGLQQKIVQPNFGSIGVRCSIEVQLDDDEVSCPERLANCVKQAYAQCRASLSQELSDHIEASEHRPPRMASEAQIRAIRALASKSRVSLTDELQDRFEVSVPDDLTLSQASQLIDSMKQDLTPSPA